MPRAIKPGLYEYFYGPPVAERHWAGTTTDSTDNGTGVDLTEHLPANAKDPCASRDVELTITVSVDEGEFPQHGVFEWCLG